MKVGGVVIDETIKIAVTALESRGVWAQKTTRRWIVIAGTEIIELRIAVEFTAVQEVSGLQRLGRGTRNQIPEAVDLQMIVEHTGSGHQIADRAVAVIQEPEHAVMAVVLGENLVGLQAIEISHRGGGRQRSRRAVGVLQLQDDIVVVVDEIDRVRHTCYRSAVIDRNAVVRGVIFVTDGPGGVPLSVKEIDLDQPVAVVPNILGGRAELNRRHLGQVAFRVIGVRRRIVGNQLIVRAVFLIPTA